MQIAVEKLLEEQVIVKIISHSYTIPQKVSMDFLLNWCNLESSKFMKRLCLVSNQIRS